MMTAEMQREKERVQRFMHVIDRQSILWQEREKHNEEKAKKEEKKAETFDKRKRKEEKGRRDEIRELRAL